jgi:hypothetical protein
MHPSWRRSFDAFLAHIGPRPSPAHSLDRIDNNRGYMPGNVRWATRKEQQRNMRGNRLLTALGRTAPLVQWAEWMKLPYTTIRQRVVKGWDPLRVLGLA